MVAEDALLVEEEMDGLGDRKRSLSISSENEVFGERIGRL